MRKIAVCTTVVAIVGATTLAVSAGAASAQAANGGGRQVSAPAGHTLVVQPGRSIQAAVDRAHSGDTVLIMPGVYRQSVLVAKDHLRIRGSGLGSGGTVIEPAATPRGSCGKESRSGICVFDPDHKRKIVGVRVDDLQVRNFEGDGVVGVGTRGFAVDNVTARNNARYGITRFDSVGGQFVNNVATGSADAGIYVGDSPQADVFVAGNDVWNNGFGILMRNAQHGSIVYNDVHDNCIGIFVWWLPGAAGESVIAFNSVRHNNKFCHGGDEVAFDYSGSGIALMGAHGVVLENNAILNNRGETPVSGGIVLVSGKSAGGPVTTGNTIRRNSAFGDMPADIVNRSGGDNTFRYNFCSRSIPDGLCRN